VEDIAGFLGAHPPFDAVDADELARLAAVTEPELIRKPKPDEEGEAEGKE